MWNEWSEWSEWSGGGGRVVGLIVSLSWVFITLLFSFVIVGSSVTCEIIRAPPPYRMVNAGLCDYKKEEKKKKKSIGNYIATRLPPRPRSNFGT